MNYQFVFTIISCISISIYAQESAPGPAGFSAGSFIPMMIVMFVVIYFFMIRPEQKKQKAKQKMVNEIRKGDKILTIGAIHGNVMNVKDDTISVKIADNTVVKFAKSAISNVNNKNGDKTVSTPEKK
jgi:preprotein translocase subunit YajC